MACWACGALAVSAHAQVFTNEAPAFGITAYNWNGHYGAAVSTADWNDDGWADITLGSSEGALRGYRNLQGNGFEMVAFPWTIGSETKALLWVDLDNDGDDDLFIQEANGRCGLLRHEDGDTFVDVTSNSDLSELNSSFPQLTTEAAGASFGDMDNDGDLDFSSAGMWDGRLRWCQSQRAAAERWEFHLHRHQFVLWHRRPHEIEFSKPVVGHNDDGLQDILVINDKDHPNALFENVGDGTFVDVAPEYNLVIDCMSASLGDFNSTKNKICFTPTPILVETAWVKIVCEAA